MAIDTQHRLNSERVKEIYMESLVTAEEEKNGLAEDSIVEVEKISGEKAKFHRERVFMFVTEISAMLNELPTDFRRNTGGGWSFLNGCYRRDGTQWTGFHEIVEYLFLLGIATHQAEYVMPRSHWRFLPGEMPYYVISPLFEHCN